MSSHIEVSQSNQTNLRLGSVRSSLSFLQLGGQQRFLNPTHLLRVLLHQRCHRLR
jgi:hypothetical protein